MKKHYLLSICLILFILFFVPIISTAATYYVDQSHGSDKNPGTLLSPWLTIFKANSTLEAGDTVYIRAGTYADEQINPLNSGKSGQYITYQSYGDEKVRLSGAIIPIYLHKSVYIKIDGLTISDCVHFFVLFDGANHNVIQNCTFQNAKAYFGSIFSMYYIDPARAFTNKNVVGQPSNYNSILANTWLDAPDNCVKGADQNCDTRPADNFVIKHGRYNLIKGNSFGNTSHTHGLTISEASSIGNVVRGNLFKNAYRRGLSMNKGTSYNLVEYNLFFNHGLNMSDNPLKASRDNAVSNPVAFQCFGNSSHMIVRKNIFENNATVLSYSGSYMHFYNNTAHKQIRTVYGEGGDYDYRYNAYKNNIFANTESLGRVNDYQYVASWYTYVQSGHVMEFNIITHNTFTGDNTMWRYGGAHPKSLEAFQGYTIDAYENNTYTPHFMDADNKNFNLSENSDLIDGGAWLTIITSSTNKDQKSFVVENAGYFYDGWSIPKEIGDVIKTANGKVTRIIKIDYESHTIFVDPPIDIVEGEGIAFDYNGSAPDIGAYEYKGKKGGGIPAPQQLKIFSIN